MFDVFRKELTVIRKDNGYYEEGLWLDGDTYEFTIKASIQGSDAEVLEALPEGYRTRESYTLFTETKLLTAKVAGSRPDIVIIKDENYQVVKVTPWQHLRATSHYEVVVVKENTDPEEY